MRVSDVLNIILTVSVSICNNRAYSTPNNDQNSSAEIPFRVIWNTPTYVCPRHNVTLGLSQYGIESNEDQDWQGYKVNIFYQTIFGSWPMILNQTKYFNGGIPQKGNVSVHIKTAMEDIKEVIPPRDFKGLGVIDMEAYVPIFDVLRGPSFEAYRNATYQHFYETHPNTTYNSSTIRQLIAINYEKYSLKFFVETLKALKKKRPLGLWGYWGYPRCARVFNTYECDPHLRKYNEKMFGMYEESTVFYPALYLNRNSIPDPAKRAIQFIRVMNEALRLSSMRKGGRVPIFPYIRYAYERENFNYISLDDLKYTVWQAVDMAQAGVIFWGDYADIGNCKLIKAHLDTMIGPIVKDAIAFAKICSDTVCSGQGRCIRKIFMDTSFRLPHEVLEAHASLYTSSFPSSNLTDLYSCICYNKWEGSSCRNLVPSYKP